MGYGNKGSKIINVDVTPEVNDIKTNFKVEQSQETAPLGNELVDGNGWVSTGWTGDFSNGFAHITGNTTPLIYPLGATAESLYQITLTVEDTDLMNSGFKFKVTIGNSAPFEMYQAVGSPITYVKGIKAIENGDLRIIPDSDFTGTVKNISVKEVIGKIDPTLTIKDSQDQNVLEARPTKEELKNVYLGDNTGSHNTSGEMNTAVGNGSMENNISGFWNIAMGYQSLHKNINGSRNISLGRWSLFENISGARNVGIGSYALHRLTTGNYNIGIGADSAWHTTTGDYNIAIGTVSLDKNETGMSNVAIGYNALRDNLDTSYNVGIGHWALRLNKSHNNTAIGSFALSETITSGGQTAIGYQALKVSTGTNNTAIGQQTALNLKGGNNNTAIGRIALLGLTSGSDNTAIGSSSIRYLTSGNRNTAIGDDTGGTLATGDNNILIGEGADVPSADTSNHMNIGKTLYGDLSGKRIGIGIPAPLAKLHIGGGSSTVPAMRINSGTLVTTPVSGAIEYDGSYLYFTNGAGTRLRLVAENPGV